MLPFLGTFLTVSSSNEWAFLLFFFYKAPESSRARWTAVDWSLNDVEHPGVDPDGADTYNTLYLFPAIRQAPGQAPAGKHDVRRAIKCPAIKYPIKTVGTNNYVRAMVAFMAEHAAATRINSHDEL